MAVILKIESSGEFIVAAPEQSLSAERVSRQILVYVLIPDGGVSRLQREGNTFRQRRTDFALAIGITRQFKRSPGAASPDRQSENVTKAE